MKLFRRVEILEGTQFRIEREDFRLAHDRRKPDREQILLDRQDAVGE